VIANEATLEATRTELLEIPAADGHKLGSPKASA
jgi:hypothetical protein